MHAFILILTVFFYGVGSRPETASYVAPDPASCVAEGIRQKVILEAQGRVRYATWACFDVEQKDKS